MKLILPIMLNAFKDLLCSKLCWHNRPGPNIEDVSEIISIQFVPFNKVSGFGMPIMDRFLHLFVVHPATDIWLLQV